VEQRIALVTGANRGIGFEVCRQLAQVGLAVILTSRNETEGKQAAAELAQEGLPVHYYPLDVNEPTSIEQLGTYLHADVGRVDVLVNNAGVFLDEPTDQALTARVETFERTFLTNVFGPLRLAQTLIPLMQRQKYGRVVHVSSGAGQLSDMLSGYPAYRMSKTALNSLTRMLAYEVRGTGILVNSMCPGWVKTAMGGPDAPRTPAEGADTVLWLATLPEDGPTGGFFRNREPIPW